VYALGADAAGLIPGKRKAQMIQLKRTRETVALTLLALAGAFAQQAAATPITIGETALFGSNDSGNGNLLLVQDATLSQSATIKSLSFYVRAASGNLRLGVYDATGSGGGPGTLKAQTNGFTPVAGWNTVNVITPVSLPAGNYWLAYLPSSSSLSFAANFTIGSYQYANFTFGAMPATFPAIVGQGTTHWSLYGTLDTTSTPTPTPTATPPAPSDYPLRASANGRYLVDSNNVPFLIIGDAPHSLITNLNSADAAVYLANRGSNGFNALWIELLCDSYTAGVGTEGSANYGHDINGNNPFTSTLPGGYYNLTTPNPAYWSNVDYIVATAAANGLQCFFTPLDEGGWTNTSLANGTTRCYAYGQFLGNRYKDSPNVIWNMGNDFQNWGIAANDAVILAIADGIRSVNNKLMTVELDYCVSESQNDPNWISRITVNGAYTYYPTYDETLVAYNKPSVMPVLFLEASYEDEDNGGCAELGTPNVLRRQEYWSLTAGALAGHMYGDHSIWPFSAGWQSHLDTPGVIQLGYFKNFFTSRNWYNLVPDQFHTLLTAGYGTYSSTGHVSESNYAMAARTPDGTLAVVYTPVSHTLTIALSNFSGPVTTRWYDPTANTFTAISGSPFPNIGTHNFTTPGNNSAGDGDWVLVFETAAPTPTPTATPTPTPTPGLVAAYGFDEGSGTVVSDVSGNGNNGTISGATWTRRSKYGRALRFNGTSALVTVPNSASLRLTGGMTLEAWVYPRSVSSARRDVIYKGNDNYYLKGTSQNLSRPAMGGSFAGSPLYGTGALTVNTWAYLAATYDGATMRFYVNGVQVASRAQTGAIATSTNPLQIGGDNIYGQYFEGRIDEVRIYNRALSVAEVLVDMNTPVGGSLSPQAATIGAVTVHPPYR
jgi:Protein of unknown function (DUF4038)/Concanavalin A-like lectin/glucanases superfamily/Putative collagen-binding domain of a collagenase